MSTFPKRRFYPAPALSAEEQRLYNERRWQAWLQGRMMSAYRHFSKSRTGQVFTCEVPKRLVAAKQFASKRLKVHPDGLLTINEETVGKITL